MTGYSEWWGQWDWSACSSFPGNENGVVVFLKSIVRWCEHYFLLITRRKDLINRYINSRRASKCVYTETRGKREEHPSLITGRRNPPRHSETDLTSHLWVFIRDHNFKAAVQWETLAPESDGFSQSLFNTDCSTHCETGLTDCTKCELVFLVDK